MRVLLTVLLFALSATASQAAEPHALLARWVQMAPGGVAEARVVIEGTACPSAIVDGKTVAMTVRAAPDQKFPAILCTVTIDPGARQLSILGEVLKLPKQAPDRIIVLGDTGCRIKGATVQACNDPGAWPFPQVAAQAAKMNPDLVIHVGDYLYRESACPKDDARCAGSPSGDNWVTWAADFFTPGKPLLEAAPWVVVRGNHEECDRAGLGFLRLLGPLAFVEGTPCTEHVAPYAVSLGAVNLVVMDNANAVDRDSNAALDDVYKADFAALPKLGTEPLWLAMHHPIWGVIKIQLGMVGGGNATLMDAEDATGLPGNVDLMLAGHIHTFEAINYTQGLPPQLIVGEGGDLLDNAPPDFSGQTIGTVKIADGLSLPGYGFLLLTRGGEGWTVDVFDSKGAHELTCTYAGRRLNCPKH
jgi:predicted phosphodiesterase